MEKPPPSKGLLIDDDDAVCELFVYCFKDMNWTWDVCTTARAGIAKIHAINNGYDVIVLDLGLPDCNGLETVKLIRAGSNAPIVVQTGGSTEDVEQQREALGVYGILAKGSMNFSRVRDSVLGAVGQWRAKRYELAVAVMSETKRKFRETFLKDQG